MTKGITSFARRPYALGDAELILCKSYFLSFWRLLENILHIYIPLYKTIAVELLAYQPSEHNSIFIFYKTFLQLFIRGKKIKLTGSHFSSYADTFKNSNNT